MMIHNLSKTNSIFNTFLAEMRDTSIQNDAMRFRRNLERIAEIMAYEVSKQLEYETTNVTTPLGEIETAQLKEQPVLATILRAGLGMHQGVLNYFDKAQSAFISAYRKHSSAEDYEIYVEYIAAPVIDDKIVIITDPMLATGNSMVTVYKALLQRGKPKKVYILSAVAHADAIDFVRKHLPANTEIWVGAIDAELTAQSYIVPGLGDAGDLAYGLKV
ncbi:MAG TPA: uracil phosphoribosyltransferase [Taishania sp.]|nr:uracil phosphoribosyltransferase [Taishania sp.]HNS42588.1 uracil phosphoribosyltransferase [Taishania sp.]